MTKDQFQEKYHYYRAKSEKEAKEEAMKVNEEGIEDNTVIAVKLDNLGWCLMLMRAASFAEKIGIIPKQ